MYTVRAAGERGHANHGWLDTYHSFSFGDYYDRNHMGFRSLRVMNEDRILAGQGFGMHPHRDMEIITYVLSGSLEHQDSLGNGSVLQAGQVQRMTAGSGIMHSEFNHSGTEPVHLYQIWIHPSSKGLSPSYEQNSISELQESSGLFLIASKGDQGGAMNIHQDADIYIVRPSDNRLSSVGLEDGMHAWVQVTKGSLSIGGHRLSEGDGVAISNEPRIEIEGDHVSEAMLFRLS